MKLSDKAITELKEILKNDIGSTNADFNKTELQELGLFLLTVDATYLKVRAQLQQ